MIVCTRLPISGKWIDPSKEDYFITVCCDDGQRLELPTSFGPAARVPNSEGLSMLDSFQ
jgi:hypothetical protein